MEGGGGKKVEERTHFLSSGGFNLTEVGHVDN